MTAREAALAALKRCRRDGAWSGEALDAAVLRSGLDARDTALAWRLALGVLQNTALLDFYIDAYSSTKTHRLEPLVLDILRLSAYQLVFMDKIPARAAVSEAVDLCGKLGVSRASGLVNAVLRRISENLGRLPQPVGESAQRLSILYSHPLWLVEELISEHGEEFAEDFLRANNSPAPLTLRVNTLKCSQAELLESLAGEGASARPHPKLDGSVILDSPGGIEGLKSFQDGLFFVQDCAATLAVLAADPAPGSALADVCAAPGGKSFTAALLMNNSGRILSCDINAKKLGRIEAGRERLGITILETAAMDASRPDEALFGCFDTVIADAPCSGLGVIRKKPEIRYAPREKLDGLPEVQLRILRGASKLAAPGGTLVYSTCTVRRKENQGVIETFLRENPGFVPEDFQLPGDFGASAGGVKTLWPHLDVTDGFFICKLRRRA